MNFQDAAIENQILKALSKALDFTMKRSEIIEKTGLSEGQVKDALYRMRKKSLITNVKRGYWKLLKLYRKIRHTKRIVETTDSHPAFREWDCDAEATSEGWVPVMGIKGALPPQRPPMAITKKYADILNPKLVQEFMTILGTNGIVLKETTTNFETTCAPKFFRVPKFCIDGTEWLDDVTGEWDGTHIVEVIFQNNVGERYPPGIGNWWGSFEVSEDEFKQ